MSNAPLPRVTFDRETRRIVLQVDETRMVLGSELPAAGVYYREDWPPERRALFDLLVVCAERGINPDNNLFLLLDGILTQAASGATDLAWPHHAVNIPFSN